MISELDRQVRLYKGEVEDFILRNQLPAKWFEFQDHIAFKAYNGDDYDSLLETFIPMSRGVSETWINERRIAAVKLLGQHAVDMTMNYGAIPARLNWVEIMEAKPDDRSDEPARLDHEEVYMPRGLIPIQSVLRRKDIQFFSDGNRSHSWISVILNDETASEFKFSDKSLEEVVKEDLISGSARVL